MQWMGGSGDIYTCIHVYRFQTKFISTCNNISAKSLLEPQKQPQKALNENFLGEASPPGAACFTRLILSSPEQKILYETL